MVTTETIVVGIVAIAVTLGVAWLVATAGDSDSDPDAESSSDDESGDTDSAGPANGQPRGAEATAGEDEASGGDESPASSTAGDDENVTQLYDPSSESQQGPQVWLQVEGERIEVPRGVAMGSELRRHLIERGVSKQRALAVSREHFMIRTVDDSVEIRDLDSTGGTVVDGTRLPPGQWSSVGDGDRVVLAGEVDGRFEIG